MGTTSNPPGGTKVGNRPVPFPDELCRSAEKLLTERHQLHLAPDERFHLRGELAHGHSSVVCELVNIDRTFMLTIETAVECEPNDIDNPIEARDVALDYVNIVFAKYFESDRFLHFRAIWQEYDLDGVAVLMRGTLTNPLLESEADKLLAEHGFDEHGHTSDTPLPAGRGKN